MLLKKHLFSACLAVVLATPVAAWEHTFTRGLDLYTTADSGNIIRLVCDPGQVYGSNETAVFLVLQGNPDITAQATFAFADGAVVTAEMTRGRIPKTAMEGSGWEPLLTGLRSAASVIITVDGRSAEMSLGEQIPFTCA